MKILPPKIRLFTGDCQNVLGDFPDNYFDSVVTDPPYELAFMGRKWDATGIAFKVEMWQEVLRVLKPGGYLLSFGGTRTYHRMTVAIEDAGFEIRDCLQWLYGSGFPKSLDISKALDKSSGVTREDKFEGSFDRRCGPTGNKKCDVCGKWLVSGSPCRCPRPQDEPQSEDAKEWQGWGTALKPAYEPIVLARKPLDGTVVKNVLEYGTGGLNIDATRIAIEDGKASPAAQRRASARNTGNAPMQNRTLGVERASEAEAMGKIGRRGSADVYMQERASEQLGRWPANVILDEEAAALLDEQSGNRLSGKANGDAKVGEHSKGVIKPMRRGKLIPRNDTGGASRFFYCAKAGRKEREAGLDYLPIRTAGDVTGGRKEGSAGLDSPRAGAGRTSGARNHHPTVKPISLMRYLVKLITPPNGIVLDPFVGSGTTGCAAVLEDFRLVGIDLEEENVTLAEARINHWKKQG